MSSISSEILKITNSLAPKREWLQQIIGTKVEHGVTRPKEVVSVLTRSCDSNTLGNLALADAGFGTGVMMNARVISSKMQAFLYL